jgi:2-oxoglutarate ferredoxin oxidoreductase subunit alpha
VKDRLTIGFVGAGGDGVVLLGSFLQRLAAGLGYYSQMPRYYEAQIRGGGSAVKLGLDAERSQLPADKLDILVCFDWDKYLVFKEELPIDSDTVVIGDKSARGTCDVPARPVIVGCTDVSKEVTGGAQCKNIVTLGFIIAILGFPPEDIEKLIANDKSMPVLHKNLPAFDAGRILTSQFTFPDMKLAPAKNKATKIIVHGDQVVGQAALKCGCRAFFGYPITPAVEVMEEMQRNLPQIGGAFLQAEDEIAACGMTLGASLTGAKAMTATSGPGLDLMIEMIGLACSAEIPLVVVDVQRCGPATGIPSKSEQSDLSHAIFGGHGDAPRVVIAPPDVEGCHRLTWESFNIAEYYQTPVIVLSDQWLGQTFVGTDEEPLKKEYPLAVRKRPVKSNDGYLRYKVSEDDISPMSAVGDEGFTYQTTGLTHNEAGAPSFGHETHHKLHEKRWQKLLPLRQRDDMVKIYGNEKAGKGIITWGSSAQMVLAAVETLGLHNDVKVCVPELIYPMPLKLEKFLHNTEQLLVIEMNYSGQLYHYLRSETDIPKNTFVYARAGGLPFSHGELSKTITEFVK